MSNIAIKIKCHNTETACFSKSFEKAIKDAFQDKIREEAIDWILSSSWKERHIRLLKEYVKETGSLPPNSFKKFPNIAKDVLCAIQQEKAKVVTNILAQLKEKAKAGTDTSSQLREMLDSLDRTYKP